MDKDLVRCLRAVSRLKCLCLAKVKQVAREVKKDSFPSRRKLAEIYIINPYRGTTHLLMKNPP
jgi:hypothetical protein